MASADYTVSLLEELGVPVLSWDPNYTGSLIGYAQSQKIGKPSNLRYVWVGDQIVIRYIFE
jgi:hypothetical protein